MDKFLAVYNYLKYKRLQKNAHGIHSPFVFEFYNKVLNNKAEYYSYEALDQLRSQLLNDQRKFEVTDLGAGSKGGLKKDRSVRSIAEVSVKNPKYSRLLFRMVNYFQPETILELGTSLGLSTISLAIARSESKVYTVEGCPNTREIAIENFHQAGLNNSIDSRLGDFKDVLPQLLNDLQSLGMVFFDGNHKKEPTLQYFELCLQKANNDSVFIFDDIYWSAEMTEAWETIKIHPKVSVSIDLYQMGIVFFRKEQVKQHFILAY